MILIETIIYCLNENRFSAMSTDEKNTAVAAWQKKWDTFISNQYENYKTKHNLAY